MQPQPTAREMYPHREVGVVLVILGILLLVFAVLIGGVCQIVNTTGPFYGPATTGCVYPYAAGAVLLGLLGFILLIVGLVVITIRNPATLPPVQYYPPVAPWPQYAPPPAPTPPSAPPAQLIACRNCGRVYHQNTHTFCPNCGTKLGP